jgi:hypothetical protein
MEYDKLEYFEITPNMIIIAPNLFAGMKSMRD